MPKHGKLRTKIPEADCVTYHELLVATIQVKLSKTKKPEIENRYTFVALDLIDR